MLMVYRQVEYLIRDIFVFVRKELRANQHE